MIEYDIEHDYQQEHSTITIVFVQKWQQSSFIYSAVFCFIVILFYFQYCIQNCTNRFVQMFKVWFQDGFK